MRRIGAAVALALLPVAARADGQVEVSIGGGVGSDFIVPGPFVFDGFPYAKGYRTCAPGTPAPICLDVGLTDVLTGRESKYPAFLVGSFEARRGIGGPMLIGVGVFGGGSIRNQLVMIGPSNEVVEGRPPFTDEVSAAAESASTSITNGAGGLAYLHAGLRWDRGFESRTTTGYRASGTRVFAEAGAGWLAVVPGGGDARIGHPLGVHGVIGVRMHRANARSLTISLRHVHAVGVDDDALVRSRQYWTVVQIGWLLDR